MLREGAATGHIPEAETAIVEMALRLGDRRASAVMTPRTQIEWLDLDDPEAENRRKIRESAYSRFPVVQGGSQHVDRDRPGQGSARRMPRGPAFRPARGDPPAGLPAEHRQRASRARSLQDRRRTDGVDCRRIWRPRGAGHAERHSRNPGRRHIGFVRSRSAGRPPRRRNLADRRDGRARRAEAAPRDLPPARRGSRFPYPGRLSDGTPQPRADGWPTGSRPATGASRSSRWTAVASTGYWCRR